MKSRFGIGALKINKSKLFFKKKKRETQRKGQVKEPNQALDIRTKLTIANSSYLLLGKIRSIQELLEATLRLDFNEYAMLCIFTSNNIY